MSVCLNALGIPATAAKPVWKYDPAQQHRHRHTGCQGSEPSAGESGVMAQL